MRNFISALACVALISKAGFSQDSPVLIKIDMENLVRYDHDTGDFTKLAANPLRFVPPPVPIPAFAQGIAIADIVAVNGKPAKGIWFLREITTRFTTNPTPGQPISDITGSPVGDEGFVLLQADGTPIGSIFAMGVQISPPPPGAPRSWLAGNFAVIGGTGAFLGVRGQRGSTFSAGGPRRSSVTEDPANRRIHGGSMYSASFHLIPMFRPEIGRNATGPLVFHTDFSQVTAANPARADEVLILQATGLGPTFPGVDPGQPFPAGVFEQVTSPVEVTLNGNPAEITNKIGWPGTTDSYRLDIKVPEGTSSGLARVQITAAWIPGSAVQINVK